MGGGDRNKELAREADALFGGGRKKPKREPARFVGLQGTARIEALEAWWRGAEKGAEFTYCEALEPIRDETWHRAGELARSGYLRTHQRQRAGGGICYFAVRTAKQLTPDPVEACLADSRTDLIFRALKRAANFGQPCPTDSELARLAGLTMRQQAGQRIRKLIDVKLISSQQLYDNGVPSRVVTIEPGRHAGPAAGKQTALPRKWAELQRAGERDQRAAGGAQ